MSSRYPQAEKITHRVPIHRTGNPLLAYSLFYSVELIESEVPNSVSKASFINFYWDYKCVAFNR